MKIFFSRKGIIYSSLSLLFILGSALIVMEINKEENKKNGLENSNVEKIQRTEDQESDPYKIKEIKNKTEAEEAIEYIESDINLLEEDEGDF